MLCMKHMNASPFFVIDLLPPERDRHVFASCKLAVVGANEKPEFIALFATSLIYIYANLAGRPSTSLLVSVIFSYAEIAG